MKKVIGILLAVIALMIVLGISFWAFSTDRYTINADTNIQKNK